MNLHIKLNLNSVRKYPDGTFGAQVITSDADDNHAFYACKVKRIAPYEIELDRSNVHEFIAGRWQTATVNDALAKKLTGSMRNFVSSYAHLFTKDVSEGRDGKQFAMDEWYKQKAIQDIKDTVDPLELAFSTLFLNRTNRSGIIKAGVIGGKKQDGAYRMDCRFNKAALIKKVHQIAAIKDKIHIYNMDAIEFIEKLESLTLPKPLLMVDPPYYNKGQSLYTNFYDHEDHAAISEKLAKTDLPWLLTYDNTPEISDLYKKFAQYEFDINYSAAKKRIGNELFITSSHFNNIEHERLKIA